MRVAPPVQRAVAVFLLVLYTACVALGGALVRCREADGSVSIEWRGVGCCVSQTAQCADAPPAVSVGSSDLRSDCAGCEDEALTKGLASVAARKIASGAIDTLRAPVHVATIVVADRVSFAREDSRRPGRHRSPIPPPLLLLRSVVLRC